MLSERMATDLRRVLVSGQRLTASQVQLILYQILNGKSRWNTLGHFPLLNACIKCTRTAGYFGLRCWKHQRRRCIC